jgi:CubicO group peptidase (beta-lactamase class C family)
MRILWTSKALLLALMVASLSLSAQSTADRIDSLLTLRHKSGKFNGVALVGSNGKVKYRKAFGIAQADRPLKGDTPFYLGSLAKSFTAMAVMMLAEKEKLAFDDPIVDYFPELPSHMSAITIRNLLNHTSGLPDYYAMGKYKDSMTNDMVMKVILDLEGLEFPAGEKYSYSNTGYVLLSLLIERITKDSYRKFIKYRIFEPLGMEYSEVFDGTQPKMDGRARGHTQEGQPNDYKALTTGAGGIYSMVDDLFLYDQALYANTLVKRETLTKAFTPAKLNSGENSYYGFGWVLEARDPKIVQHSGSLAGFRTFFYRDTGKKQTIILLSNFTNDVSALKDELVEIINP